MALYEVKGGQMAGFGKEVDFSHGGSVTNGDTPSSLWLSPLLDKTDVYFHQSRLPLFWRHYL